MLQAISEGLLRLDPGLLIWTIICFSILLLILWKAAWRPIVTALDARAERIRKDLETAESSRQDAEKMFFKHKSMIENAHDEVMKIVVEGRSDAERVKNEIIDRANAEAQAILSRAQREIDFAKEKALEELRAEIVNISTGIASKVIERNLTPEDNRRIIEDELAKLV